jgi:hypothetical protein
VEIDVGRRKWCVIEGSRSSLPMGDGQRKPTAAVGALSDSDSCPAMAAFDVAHAGIVKTRHPVNTPGLETHT